MKVCCGVTLYYPTENELMSVHRYKDIFDCIFIYDNTDNINNRNIEYFLDYNGFRYITEYKNNGLSLAYNVMCRMAIANGYEYICLFDQDSLISLDDLNLMISFIANDNNSNVGIYAPNIVYTHKDIKNMKCTMKNNIEYEEVEWAISSGSFINLSIYKMTQGFDENYFIDRLDYDYCYEIRKKGYKVIKVMSASLHQTLGEPRVGHVSQHNYIRHYYMSRNRVYFYLNKSNEFLLKRLAIITALTFRHIFIIFKYEDNKLKKMFMILIGIRDFKNKKMGKYEG